MQHPTIQNASPTIALALGGGGARGLAHIHVIEALDELGLRPVVIAGSSIGAIMGAAAAAGMSGRDIHDYARGILSRRARVASRMWSARPPTIAEFLKRGLRVSQFDLERLLAAFMPDDVPARFEDLAIPLRVVATDFYGHCTHVIGEGDLISGLAASAAIPALFQPVSRDGRVLVDGGVTNPLPFDLIDGLADVTIAVDVAGAPELRTRKRLRTIDIVVGTGQLMMQAIIDGKLAQRAPDILLRPPVSRFLALDFLKVNAILDETAPLKEEVKRALDTRLNALARVGVAAAS